MQDSSPFQFLAIDTIHESTTNPRRTFDEAKLYELAESIKHNGLIQPITVRPNHQGFEIVAGARRYRAAQLAELFSVPARIVEIDDAKALEWQLRLAQPEGTATGRSTARPYPGDSSRDRQPGRGACHALCRCQTRHHRLWQEHRRKANGLHGQALPGA
jgi:ParB family chromosome partitioning protein